MAGKVRIKLINVFSLLFDHGTTFAIDLFVIRKLRKPRINEYKRRMIVNKTASGDSLKGIPPVFWAGRSSAFFEIRSKSRYRRVVVSNGSQTMQISGEEGTDMRGFLKVKEPFDNTASL
jgi:hypothetical protein